MRTTTKIITGGVAGLALSGLVGASLATADPTTSPSPAPSATTSPNTKPDREQRRADKGPKRNLAQRALHGEVTVGGAKRTRVMVFQRGTVSKISDTAVTVKSVDGFTATYAISDQTKVRQAKQDVTLDEIAAQDRVRVVARKDGATLTAQRIAERRTR